MVSTKRRGRCDRELWRPCRESVRGSSAHASSHVQALCSAELLDVAYTVERGHVVWRYTDSERFLDRAGERHGRQAVPGGDFVRPICVLILVIFDEQDVDHE